MDSDLRQALKSAGSWADLQAVLHDVERDALGARDVHVVHRALSRSAKSDGLSADLRVAYLSNHTVEPLPGYVEVAAAFEGLHLASYVGPSGQHFQEVLTPGSGLESFGPDVILLELSMRTLSPRIYGEFLSLSAEARRKEREEIVGGILDWVMLARQNTDATLLIANFPRPVYSQAGIADTKTEYGEAEFYAELNLELLRGLRGDSRAFLFDLDAAITRVGTLGSHDPKLYYVAKMQWDAVCAPQIAEELLRYVKALKGQTRKCLVLDLDNTLWGGVVGEDGPLGVKVGEGDPVAEAFQEFQRAIRALKEKGTILALCSKNNPEDALEVFEKRPEMVLAIEDFSAQRINWEPKPANIASIAAELNIGEDSVVFIDDNPAECELVRQVLPHVKVIHLPRDPSLYAGLLRKTLDFEKLTLTEEDREKAEQYRENAERESMRTQVGDLESYIEKLGTVVSLGIARDHHVPRVHQLFTKSNQFNVTTVRYSLAEVEGFVADARFNLGVMRVEDKFGDLGIVGLYLVEDTGDIARIDSVIMSCRAMGRGIETALINRIKADHLDSGRASALEAEFRPTQKNKPVAALFEQQGFALIEAGDDGSRRYRLEAGASETLECPGIAVQSMEND